MNLKDSVYVLFIIIIAIHMSITFNYMLELSDTAISVSRSILCQTFTIRLRYDYFTIYFMSLRFHVFLQYFTIFLQSLQHTLFIRFNVFAILDWKLSYFSFEPYCVHQY